MPATALIGVPLTMAQNTVYCVPIRSCIGAFSPAAAVVQGSIDTAFTAAIAYVQSPALSGQITNGLPFIRCTDAAGATIVFRAQ